MSQRKFFKVRHRTDLTPRPSFRDLSRQGNGLSSSVTAHPTAVNDQITDAVTQTVTPHE